MLHSSQWTTSSNGAWRRCETTLTRALVVDHASFLLVQSLVHGNLVEINRVRGSENVVDWGTKYVSTRVLETLLETLAVRSESSMSS